MFVRTATVLELTVIAIGYIWSFVSTVNIFFLVNLFDFDLVIVNTLMTIATQYTESVNE